MGTIKDRNGMGLIEAEDFKKRRQEYTEELYKKGLNDPDNHNGVVLENLSFHSNPKERQCQRMFKLLHNSTYFIH